jgi:hypothetical protein
MPLHTLARKAKTIKEFSAEDQETLQQRWEAFNAKRQR